MKNRNFIKNSIIAFLPISLGLGVLLGVSRSSKVNHQAVETNATVGSYSRNHSTYYTSAFTHKVSSSQYGSSLLLTLHELMYDSHESYNTYGELWDYTINTDYDIDNPDNIILLYSRQSVDGSYATQTWNREHVWCKSRSGGLYPSINNNGKGAGADIHHLRPANSILNSTRNDIPYGIVSDHSASKKLDVTDCYYDSNNFEPADYIKGDVARILMYTYMHYSSEIQNGSGSYNGALSITNIVNKNTAQSAWDLLMDWNESDPVDYSEVVRNNAACVLTGNFNPFIDHPEFARMIWDDSTSQQAGLFFNSSYVEVSKNSTITNTASKYGYGTLSDSITYTSDNPEVATVNSNGVITGVSDGIARIKARATINGISKISYCFVKVGSGYAPKRDFTSQGIVYTPTSSSTVKKSATAGSETVSFSNTYTTSGAHSQITKGNKATLTISNFSKTVSSIKVSMHSTSSGTSSKIDVTVGGQAYKSVNGTFASLNGGVNSMVFTPIDLTNSSASTKTGTIQIVVEATNGSTYLTNFIVDYSERSKTVATEITVSPNANTITPGEDLFLITTFSPSSTTLKSVTWSSSNTSVAKVDYNGRVKAISVGNATITATAKDGSGVSGSTTITVANQAGGDTTPKVNSVTVSPKSASLYLNGTYIQQLTVSVSVSYGAAQTVSWSSSNTSVATVTSSGLVTGKAAGSATITVRSTFDNTKSDTCTITVYSTTPTLSSITVSGYTSQYSVNDTFSFDGVCTATYSNSSTAPVTPTSVTSPNMATPGEKTITVSYTEGGVTKTTTYNITVSESQGYTLVTDASKLVAGTTFVLAHESTNTIGIGGWSSTYFTTTTISIADSTIATNTSAMVFTLEGTAGEWNIKSGDYYYGLQNNTTALRNETVSGNNYSWTISISNGIATMKTAGSSTRSLCYNSSANPARYSAYTASNQYTQVRLFARIPSQSVLNSVTSSGQTTIFSDGSKFSYGGTLTAHYTQGKADATVSPTSFKFGISNINPTSSGTTIDTNTTMDFVTHNGKYIYVIYTENQITKWDSYQISVTTDPSLSWTAPTINVFSGTSLSGSDANNWNVTYDNGAGSQTVLTYSQFSVILGGSTISLPYTWQPSDDGKTLAVSCNSLTTSTTTVSIVQTLNAINMKTPGDPTTKTWNATSGCLGTAISEVGSSKEGTLTFDDSSTMSYTRTLEYTASGKSDYVSFSSPYQQFGSSNALNTLVLEASNTATVTQVVVTCWAKNGATDVSVTVGGNAYDTSKSAPSSAGSVTFTGSAFGNIVITMEKAAKTAGCAQYIASVAITTVGSGASVNIANVAGHEDAQRAVVKFAKAFNTAMDTTSSCTTNMSSAWSSATSAWNIFLSEAAALGSDEETYAKNLIKYATAQWSDGTDSNYQYCLERALATYGKCVSVHGQTAFMSAVRPLGANASINTISILGIKSSNTIVLIVIISLISITAIGGYFFLKSRKQEG